MTTLNPARHDALIVGGSFAGLSAALMLARARKRVLLVDGGQPRNRFSDHAHSLLGHDGKPPEQLLGEAIGQLMAYPTVELRIGYVQQASQVEGGFRLTLDEGTPVEGSTLVLATGMRDVLPDIPGLAPRWGQSVLHCPYCHGYEVAGGQLAVLANSSMSVHQAEMIPEWGATTYFTQGRFEPTDEEMQRLLALGVVIEREPVVELEGEGTSLSAVVLADGRRVPVQAMFTAPKLAFTSPLAEQLGCKLADGPLGPYVVVDGVGATSVPGVFAGGDMASPMSSAVLSVSSGAMAGLAAHRALMAAKVARALAA
ncbi:NAD(P)/FAD-dependent oxidoreductase [Pseudoxanthomonas sp.]|uniref:NAD(P)/FAD-dependent oxidoreductase n=1 Tax=Pseudoxanthomonas sp. TaxID=1871049 RepID=UPI002617C1D4|nr:NAD(P)/FAD-dependent oxidoreductase [Pseudoxanthomonas sp.]WDS37448.1 MAG: NAD(P)/FAD-dependent oxidoreductase [Pseudoxanthomonas sp.]